MRRLAVVSVAALVLPGSGLLWLNGLPLTSVSEFAAVVVVLATFLVPATRRRLAVIMNSRAWLKPMTLTILTVVCLTKVLTFFWMPYGRGFEACYRSIYAPLANSGECERSFDNWWGTKRSSLGTSNISRVEPVVDFGPPIFPSLLGASFSTWDLPFTNDYPRLGALWLDRIPFTAQFGTTLESDSAGYLIVYGTGEFQISLGAVSRASDPNTSYLHEQLVVVPVKNGVSALRLNYQHADEIKAEIPEEPPPIKGLSPRLLISEILRAEEVKQKVNLRIRLAVVDRAMRQAPTELQLRGPDGSLVATAEPSERPDLASALKNPSLLMSGFNFEIPLHRLPDRVSEMTVHAVHRTATSLLGAITVELSPSEGLSVETRAEQGIWNTPQFSVWFDTDATKLNPLRPEATTPTGFSGLALHSLLFFITLASVALVLLTLVVFGREMWRGLGQAAITLVILYAATRWLWNVSLPKFGGAPVLWMLVATPLAIWLVRSRQGWIGLLAIAGSAGVATITDLTARFHSIPDDAWWGRMIFFSRYDDWFVTQGYARQILVEDSLRGGEGVFYFQPGVRYLIFLAKLVLGENDVLISILLLSALLSLSLLLGRFLQQKFSTQVGYLILGTTTFLIIVLWLSESTSVFAVRFAGEYPTWILLTAFVLLMSHSPQRPSSSTYLLAAAVAGAIPNLRPNQLGGAIMLFLIVAVSLLQMRDLVFWSRTIALARATAIFVAVLLLSLAHNLHYGETFTLFSVTGQLNAESSWTRLLSEYSFGNAMSFLWDKAQLGLYWGSIPDDLTFALIAWTAQAFWVATTVALTVRRRVTLVSGLWLLFPLANLLPLLPYRFDSYYPRHIVIIQLGFALSSIVALAESRHRREPINHTAQALPQ
jgi:hypothetical protein